MSALSPVSRIPLPTDDDILDFNGIAGDFCQYLDGILVPRYSSTAARDAAHSSGATVGEIITITDASGGVLLQTNTVAGWATVEDVETVWKPTATSRSSTTTPTADPDLQFTLLPMSTYLIKGKMSWFSTSAAPDIRASWIVTGSGLTCIARVIYGGHDGTSGGGEPGYMAYTTNISANLDVGLIDNSKKHLESYLYVTTSSTSVTLAFAWSQANNNGTALQLLEGSFLEANRIA